MDTRGMVQQPFTESATTWMTAFWLARREQTKAAQYGVMGLAKGRCTMPQASIACDPCLVLNALDCSVFINTMLLEY